MFDLSDQLLNSPFYHIFPFYRLMINYSLHISHVFLLFLRKTAPTLAAQAEL